MLLCLLAWYIFAMASPDKVGAKVRAREAGRFALQAGGLVLVLAALGAITLLASRMGDGHTARYEGRYQPPRGTVIIEEVPTTTRR